MSIEAILAMMGYILLAPIVGGLLAGLDRLLIEIIQGRSATNVLQPFREMIKLFPTVTDRKSYIYIIATLILTIIAGSIFYSGGNIVLVILLFIFAGALNAIGRYIYHSNRALLEREILRVIAHLIQLMLVAIGLYLIVGYIGGLKESFYISDIISIGGAPAYYLPGILVGMIILILIQRNSFLTDTDDGEYKGKSVFFIELNRWYEIILLYGFLFIFNFSGTALTVIIALVICILVYLLRLMFITPLSNKIDTVFIYAIGLISLLCSFINIVVILV